MALNAVEQYRRWFAYERESHEAVLRSLETVPGERLSGPEFCKAVELVAHLAAGRGIWLARLSASPPPKDLFPRNVDLATAAANLRAVQERWADYFARLSDAELERVLTYQAF